MTRTEIASMVGSLGIPYAYLTFQPDENGEIHQDLPACIFMDTEHPDLYADDTNYTHIATYAWELYEDSVDFSLHDQLEGILKAHGLTYVKQGTEWFDDQRYWATVYLFTVIINEETSNG